MKSTEIFYEALECAHKMLHFIKVTLEGDDYLERAFHTQESLSMKLAKPNVIRHHEATEDCPTSSELAFSLVCVLVVVVTIPKLYFSFILEW